MPANYGSINMHQDGESCESAESSENSSGILVGTKDEPEDKYNFVFWIILLNGIGVLLPWNMFITIAPSYYVDYWFTVNGTKTSEADNFMAAMGIVAQIPAFAIAIINVLNILRGPLVYRIVSPLAFNCLLVVLILIFVIFQHPSDSARNWFYIVSLCIIMAMNGSNSLYQNSFFGLVADFPAKYTNAVVVGTNICGTFTSILQIISTLAFPNAPTTEALLYFAISLVVLVVCFVSWGLVRRNEFFRFYVERGEEARKLENAQRFDIKQYIDSFKYCYLQIISIFLVYFVTLSVFPTILVGFEPRDSHGNWSSVFPKNVYNGITTFLCFNLFAAIGSSSANYFQIPGPKYLIIPCVLRLIFIPFFMFANYLPDTRSMPVLYWNEWIFFFGNVIMAYTSGYFSSLGLMYAPRVCPPHLAKLAGQIAALFLVAGITSGVGFTYAIKAMVLNF